MTLPHERRRAIDNLHDFVLSLADAKRRPGLPRSLRREALARLKHYPMGVVFDFHYREIPEEAGKNMSTQKAFTRAELIAWCKERAAANRNYDPHQTKLDLNVICNVWPQYFDAIVQLLETERG